MLPEVSLDRTILESHSVNDCDSTVVTVESLDLGAIEFIIEVGCECFLKKQKLRSCNRGSGYVALLIVQLNMSINIAVVI